MSIDRSKYRKASSEEIAQKSEEMESRKQNSNSASFLKVDPGLNKFRIFPAPLKSESSLFCFPKVCSFLPLIVDEVDENGNKTGKQIEKRRAVFNAKVHGSFSTDIVEAYIDAVREKYSATIKDKKILKDKLKPITDWRTGIRYSSSWCCYAIKYTGVGENRKKSYGRLQLTDGVKKQLDALCLREGEAGIPITVDLFSHPDTGKPFQWTSQPNAEDAKQKNKVNILFEEDFPLEDEELEMLEDWPSLEELYTNSYKKTDFVNQVKGLQLFDQKNKIKVFDTAPFQSVIESFKAELEEKLGDEEDSSEKSSKEKSEEIEIPEILEEMDKSTLMSLPKLLELDITLKTTTPPSKMRKMLLEALISNFELEGDSETISTSITEIISSSLEEDSDNSETEDNDESEENYTSEEENEESTSEEEEEEAPAPKKGHSLLDKYKNRKK